MKIVSVIEYVVMGDRSYYPGDVVDPTVLLERGVAQDMIAHLLRRGVLAEGETADPPEAVAGDLGEMLLAARPSPVEEEEPHEG